MERRPVVVVRKHDEFDAMDSRNSVSILIKIGRFVAEDELRSVNSIARKRIEMNFVLAQIGQYQCIDAGTTVNLSIKGVIVARSCIAIRDNRVVASAREDKIGISFCDQKVVGRG